LTGRAPLRYGFAVLARRAIAPATCALALLAAAPARADQQVVAAAITRYVTPAVTIAPGEPLTFVNKDPLLPHNVVARDLAPEGTPLFWSATISGGAETPVIGADALEPGTYAFHCTIHPAQMNGTLTVGDGTESDTSPPALQARVGSSGLRTLERRRVLRATLTSDEAVTGTVTVRALGRTLAHRIVVFGPGTKAVAVRLAAAGLRAVRRRSRVSLRLTVRAQDDAGNEGTATAQRTLRRR